MESLLSLSALLDFALLAQVPIEDTVKEGIPKIMAVAGLLSLGGVIYSGFKFMQGDTGSAIAMLIGALLVGAAPIISQAFMVQ